MTNSELDLLIKDIELLHTSHKLKLTYERETNQTVFKLVFVIKTNYWKTQFELPFGSENRLRALINRAVAVKLTEAVSGL